VKNLMLLSLLIPTGAALAQDLRLSPAAADDASWIFSKGGEFPGATGRLEVAAEGVLRLHYDFTGGGAYVACYRRLDPPQPVRRWRLRLRKPAEASVTIRMTDGGGQTFQKATFYDHSGWQDLEVGYGGWSVHWGGTNDGVFASPLTQIGIVLDRQGLLNLTGVVEIAAVVAELGEPEGGTVARYRGEYQVTAFADGSGFWANGGGLAGARWRTEGSSARLSHSISLFGNPREVRLKLRGGMPGAVLTLELGSHFQGFRRRLGTLTGGEQTFAVPTPPEGWEHSGGEDDGVVRPPLRVTGLVLEPPAGGALAGSVELLGLACVTELPADRTVTLHAGLSDGGLAGGQRRLNATCAAWNVTDQPVRGVLKAVFRDWEDSVLAERTLDGELPALGARKGFAVAAEVPADRQFADVTFTWEQPGLRPDPATAGWTGPAPDAGSAALEPDSPWGMGVYLYRNGNDPAGHASMDRVAALAQAAGVKWSREEFQWQRIETAPGQFDFSFYDALVDTAARHGICVYALLAYWNPHYPSYSVEGIEAYCRWARALVERYKGRIRHWEIYNEPNIFFWSGPKELYPVMLRRAYETIKAADPEAKVLGVSTAGIDRAFVQRVLEAGAPFDILTIHPYRGGLVERQFVAELRQVSEQVGRRPVWITEMGWPTQIGGTPEREQAELLARCYLSAMASGAVGSMSWYDFRSDGPDPFYHEDNFGVLTGDLRPKPAYRALLMVLRRLNQGAFTAREDFPAGVWALQRGGVLAVWCPAATVALRCRVAGEVTVTNLMGEALQTAGAGDVSVRLRRGKPVFLSGAPVTPLGADTLEGDATPGRIAF